MTKTQVVDAVRERDGCKCVECGMTDDEHQEKTGKRLDVHRKIPGTVYSLGNCILLCHSLIPKSAPGIQDPERHNSFLLRLPDEARPILEELTKFSRRSFTQELLLALENYHAEQFRA